MITGFAPATLNPVAVTYQSLLIQSTQQAVAIGEAIEQAVIDGKVAPNGGLKMGTYPDGTLGWILQITVGDVLYTAYQYDWLVMDSDNNLSLWHGGSAWAGINPEYTSKFSVDPIAWDATTTPPVATAAANGTATITFPQPTSANAPFTYSVAFTDTTSSTTGAATFTEAVDADGNVVLTVTGLTVGHVYHFAVTVTTPYDGVTATAAATTPITATT